MLDPDYLDRAGDMVAAVYGEIEADMLAHLCRLLLDKGAEGLGQRGTTALNLLAQSAAPQLMAFIERHREDANRAVLRTVEDALGRSDRTDLGRMPKDARDAAGRTLPRQVELTAQGVAEILARDNVDMAQGALSLWNRCVAEAAAKVNAGTETAERAIHQAVRRMMREGISTVAYRDAETGRQTVVNRIDVAVRRHVRTQIAQDGMRRTLDVCAGAGVRLVEVSSHGGARPSHARWQGRVYSLNGDVEIGGVRYRDFYRETGYGKVDGLGGANCRHSFGPWAPGTPRMYSAEPSHPSGLPSDEVYRLAQGQRRRERDIRQTKRELAGAQLIADKDASMANIAEVEKLKAKLRGQQDGLRRYIDEANRKGRAPVLQRSPNREWAGDMPRVRKTDASRRTMREFMDGDGVKRALKAKGVSKTAAQKALSEEMKHRGMEPRDFSALSKTSQRKVFGAALARRKPTKAEVRREKMKPVNEALYNSQKNYVERHGGQVQRGTEEALQHLRVMDVDAIYVMGAQTIYFHERPSTSEVLEEVFHFKQDMRGDYSEYGIGLARTLRERDAQRYLLEVAERYNIPKEETEQTRKALEEYLKDLREAGFDEDLGLS
jgi:hypothetical protein|nr:MAG TPA: minor capsid protein [Caudoviricetes sp.]